MASERRACRALGQHRSTQRKVPCGLPDEERLTEDIIELARSHRRAIPDFSQTGKPTDNSFVEAFNGKVRAECIDQKWFLTLEDAKLKCEAFRHDYNHVRPRSSIGLKTPVEFIESIGDPSPPTGS